MGRKLGLASLFFRVREGGGVSSPPPSSSSFSASSSWPWPSCKHPRTHSFRAAGDSGGNDIFKTVNSVYFDSTDSCFTNTSEDYSESFSTASEDSGGESSEMVIRGLRSDRLFFEPGSGTSSILEEAKGNDEIGPPFKESVAMAMESDDPYRDFRVSMEEMVAAQGVRDWPRLEELLVWYLRVNGKKTHGFILGAFVDLLVGIASSPAASSKSFLEGKAPSSHCSSSSSLRFEIEEVGDEEDEHGGES